MAITLIKPSLELLPSYLEALREGSFSAMQLGFGNATPDDIEHDSAAYIEKVTSTAPYPVTLSGREYMVTEHELLWITDGKKFLGTVALRYKGDREIMEDYAGHLGLAIRPALLNRGFGKLVLKSTFSEMARRLKNHGLQSIYATCNPDNKASIRLIEFLGGRFIEQKPDVLGKGPSRRYEITL